MREVLAFAQTFKYDDGSTYVADTPGDGALFTRCRCLICLALDAEVHDVVSADGAVVDDDVPSPQSDRVPLSSS